MNLDLLTKLVKLANNNPNEHEANSAARRACKLIEEGKFNFTIDTAKSNPRSGPSWHDEVNYNDIVEMFFGGRRARKWSPFDPVTPDEPKTWNDVHRSTESQFKSHRPFSGWEQKVKPKPEQRSLKCKTCGKFKLSRFVGLEDIFECNECQWTAYTRTKVK